MAKHLVDPSPDPEHDSVPGGRALHHPKAVQEAVGDARQDRVPVV